ncbi:hypothetical protein FRC17_000049 [Serendipita sp. 399]|nr:hypothetical protein FRC17_000049 [Serendipita sp. 399]
MEVPIDISATVQELKNEFCPPLDESLLLALCGDLEATKASIDALKETLSTLAADALAISISTSELSGSGDSVDNSSNSALPSTISSSSLDVTSSALQFLRAAFPDLPLQLLQDALETSSNESEVVEMEKIVEDLLSAEILIEEDEGPLSPGLQLDGRNKPTKQPKPKPQKIVIGDVRQRQVALSSNKTGTSTRIDPWTHLSSLADYISTLISTSPSILLSLFHSPDYPSTFSALSSHLNSLSASKRTEEDLSTALVAMKEVLAAEDFNMQWARTCLIVTDAQIAESLDLYMVLKRLEQGGPIAHAKPSSINEKSPTFTPIQRHSPIISTAEPRSPLTPFPSSAAKRRSSKYDPEGWQTVDRQSPRSSKAHPHAEYIPAYRNLKAVPAWTVQEGDIDEVAKNRAVEQSWRERRAEALRKAGHHWQRSQDGHGRQIAAYYADEANKYLRESREAAVEAARALVVRNRERNQALGYNTQNSIDLHGMTREEALVIVNEALATRSTYLKSSQWDEPLRFITGKGNHSAGKQSVLLPSIMKALRSEGWKVREIEAGIAVYGKV